MNINKHILVGRLGQDPEIRVTKDGKKVATLSVAVGKQWKDATTGETKKSTSWHKVVIFSEHAASVAERFLKKGSACYIEGEVLTRKYTGTDGIERYITETVVQAFGGNLQLLDRLEKPPAADADAYRQDVKPADSADDF